MFALVFQVDFKHPLDPASLAELDEIVTTTKAMPGFLRGTWTCTETNGLSLILVDDEDVARGVAANASVPADSHVTLRSVDVYEVLREA